MSIPKNSQNIFTFITYLGLYLLVNTIFSVITSGGWTAILIFGLYGGLANLALFIIVLIWSLILSFGYNKKQIEISTKQVLFIIFFQIFLILFNVGGCGDSSRSIGNFIQRLSVGNPPCYEINIKNLIDSNLIILGFILNFILLIIFIIKSLFSSKKLNNF